MDAVDRLLPTDAGRLQKEGKYWITTVPVDPFALHTLVQSRGEYDQLRLSLPDLDRLVDQAESATDQTERLQLYRQMRRTIIEHALNTPVGDYANFSGANLKVNCLTYDVHGWSPFLYDVTLK
jgi:ABC-type transport system substrate-binding protein